VRVPLACFVVGCALMLAFDNWVTRVLGVGLLFAFIVTGVFAFATPERLDQEE
jgi:hypothetical protein